MGQSLYVVHFPHASSFSYALKYVIRPGIYISFFSLFLNVIKKCYLYTGVTYPYLGVTFFFYSNTMVLFLSLSLLPVLVSFKKRGFSKALCVFVHIILIVNTSKQDEVVSKNVCLCKCVVFEILPDLDVSQVTIYVLFYSILYVRSKCFS